MLTIQIVIKKQTLITKKIPSNLVYVMPKRKVKCTKMITNCNIVNDIVFYLDDASSKLKKNNVNNQKHNSRGNEENIKVNNIILLHENNLKTTVFDSCNLLPEQFLLQTNGPNVAQSYDIETMDINPELGMFYKI